MRVLLIEDEVRFAETLARGLRRHGFAVDLAHDGQAGLSKVALHSYDLIVLDRDLPKIHGDDLCRMLVKGDHPSRVLMLTAAATNADMVSGLDLGADDYLAKPFDFDVLVARLRALSRRSRPSATPLLERGDLIVDPALHEVTYRGRKVSLTAREFAVLEHLARAAGAVVSAEELLEKAWDEHADPFTTSVRVIISRLRTKLADPTVITTIIGRGYRL